MNYALKLAERGLAVFPLAPYSKIPTKGSSGVKEATSNVDRIRAMWMGKPEANIGLAVGKCSGIVGIDLDYNHGASDEDLKKFPRTVTVRTRNGYHLYYRYPAGGVASHVVLKSESKQGAAYLRSDGYYFVGPSSTVALDTEGQSIPPWDYQYHSDAAGELSFEECPLAELPAFCFAPSKPSPVPVTAPSGMKAAYGPNTRHDMLKSTAVAMRKRGESPDKIEAELHKRNLKDCNPPKENAAQEISSIVKWALESVQVNDVKPIVKNLEQQIIPLGHFEGTYYYSSSRNREIVQITRAAHTSGGLLDLMPLEFWKETYGYDSKRGGVIVDWLQAASDMMQACREEGIFTEKRIRGVGAWLDEGKLVLHLGDRLLVNSVEDSVEVELTSLDSKQIYALGPSLDSPHQSPLSAEECKALREACAAPVWRDRSSAILLAGGLAVLRICGALPWRPMLWLTGPSGSGKTTLMDRVVNPIAGKFGLFIQGNTTEAGIRQELHCDSRPVIFDEAETKDKRSANRVNGILELARQASSNTDGRILKGTADGKGHNFKVNSAFFMASIQDNLKEEADKNRFCRLELDRNDPLKWNEVQRVLDCITPEFGDRLFSRMIRLYPMLMKNRAILEDLIAANTDRRTAQQHGILLAGYVALITDRALTKEEAAKLINSISTLTNKSHEASTHRDETECLELLLQGTIYYDDNDGRRSMTVSKMLTLARGEGGTHTNWRSYLQVYGLDVFNASVMVAYSHLNLRKTFVDSRWEDNWANSLSRLPGAERGVRHRFEMRQIRCIKIPLVVVFPDGLPLAEPDVLDSAECPQFQ